MSSTCTLCKELARYTKSCTLIHHSSFGLTRYSCEEETNQSHSSTALALLSVVCKATPSTRGCSQLTHNKSCTRKEQHVNELVAPAPDPFHARPPQQQLELLGHPRDTAVAPLLTPEGRSEKAHRAMPCRSDSQYLHVAAEANFGGVSGKWSHACLCKANG